MLETSTFDFGFVAAEKDPSLVYQEQVGPKNPNGIARRHHHGEKRRLA